ncbi:MAG TPA: hypothetical protein PLX15_01950 [Candidatus Woesearchaeota archaeon]|jgi:hypothetical protein|nr:hypothetical protein [Candidatus Woesearchaeota archaeon]
MAEKIVMVKPKVISYSGLFIMKELYHTVDSWLKENGYDKEEKKAYEKVSEKGKTIEIKYEPFKKITDYSKYILEIQIRVQNLVSVEITDKGKNKIFNKGDVEVTLQGDKISDYENYWESKPFYFFMRTVFRKFILKDEESKQDSKFKDDFDSIAREIKDHLNMHKFIRMS